MMKIFELQGSRWLSLRKAHWEGRAPGTRQWGMKSARSSCRSGEKECLHPRAVTHRPLNKQGAKGTRLITKDLGANATEVESPTETATPSCLNYNRPSPKPPDQPLCTRGRKACLSPVPTAGETKLPHGRACRAGPDCLGSSH